MEVIIPVDEHDDLQSVELHDRPKPDVAGLQLKIVNNMVAVCCTMRTTNLMLQKSQKILKISVGTFIKVKVLLCILMNLFFEECESIKSCQFKVILIVLLNISSILDFLTTPHK